MSSPKLTASVKLESEANRLADEIEQLQKELIEVREKANRPEIDPAVVEELEAENLRLEKMLANSQRLHSRAEIGWRKALKADPDQVRAGERKQMESVMHALLARLDELERREMMTHVASSAGVQGRRFYSMRRE